MAPLEVGLAALTDELAEAHGYDPAMTNRCAEASGLSTKDTILVDLMAPTPPQA